VINMLDFVDITKDNVHWYCKFKQNFENDIKIFMSCIYPENSDFFVPLTEKGQLKWSYLIYDNKTIGAIWLEKEHSCLPVAKLSIFIADKDMRNRGIGQRAIDRYIRKNKNCLKLSQVTLDVCTENIRAISCFKKCMFVCEQKYEKTNGVKVMRMVKSL